jgi:hypothetical protein
VKAAIGLAVVLSACAAGDSQQRLRTAVDAKQATLTHCYADALTRDRAAAGMMKLWLHVPDDGTAVDAVEIESAKIKSKALNKCVRGALVGVRIGAAADSEMKVQYTLAFQPDSEE